MTRHGGNPLAKTKLSLPAIQAGIVLTAVAVAAPARAEPAPTGMMLALSEIKREDVPPPAPSEADAEAPAEGVPMPDPIRRLPLPNTPQAAPSPEGTTVPDDELDESVVTPDEPAPDIIYDLSLLPEEVRRMRELILTACRKGDLEALRPLLGMGDDATQLSFGEGREDPIEFLREISGDENGQEILAILLEILDAGYVHLEPGTPNELYVWPYFFAAPLDKLSAEQRVELFKIVTAGDYEEMKLYGAYNFYRTGIAPDGRWVFFVAGD